LSLAGAKTIPIGQSHIIKDSFISVLNNMDHNMVFTLGCGRQQNQQNFAGNFDCHRDVVVQCGAHRLMEHIPASLEATVCMLPLGECLRRISLAAAMVNDFV
jgi:hypothetical protein